jgi:hypothetical protein
VQAYQRSSVLKRRRPLDGRLGASRPASGHKAACGCGLWTVETVAVGLFGLGSANAVLHRSRLAEICRVDNVHSRSFVGELSDLRLLVGSLGIKFAHRLIYNQLEICGRCVIKADSVLLERSAHAWASLGNDLESAASAAGSLAFPSALSSILMPMDTKAI